MHSTAQWLNLSFSNEERESTQLRAEVSFSSYKHNSVISEAAKDSQRPPAPLNLGGFPSHLVLPNFFSCSALNMNIFKIIFTGFTVKRHFFSEVKTINYKSQCSFWKEFNCHYNISLCFPFPFPSLSSLCSPLFKPLLITLLLYLTAVMNCDTLLRVTVTQHIHTNSCCSYSIQMQCNLFLLRLEVGWV